MQKDPCLKGLLHALLAESPAPSGAPTSNSERSLLRACAFLRACLERKLTFYLGRDPGRKLRDARLALLEIGLPEIAEALANDGETLSGPGCRKNIATLAHDIEERIEALQSDIAISLTRYAALVFLDDEEFLDHLRHGSE